MTAYCLWAFDYGKNEIHHGHHPVWIQLAVVPLLIGLLRILRMLDAGEVHAPEDLLMHDRVLQVLGTVWLVLLGIGIYS